MTQNWENLLIFYSRTGKNSGWWRPKLAFSASQSSELPCLSFIDSFTSLFISDATKRREYEDVWAASEPLCSTSDRITDQKTATFLFGDLFMVAVVMSLAETQQSSSEGGVGSSGVCGKENFLFWVRPAEICDTTSTFNVNKTTQSENQVQDIHHKWLCIVF